MLCLLCVDVGLVLLSSPRALSRPKATRSLWIYTTDRDIFPGFSRLLLYASVYPSHPAQFKQGWVCPLFTIKHSRLTVPVLETVFNNQKLEWFFFSVFKETVHPKMKNVLQTIKDIDPRVCFFIFRFVEMCLCISVSAVNGCRQNESLIKTSQHSSLSVIIRSWNKSCIKMFFLRPFSCRLSR